MSQSNVLFEFRKKKYLRNIIVLSQKIRVSKTLMLARLLPYCFMSAIFSCLINVSRLICMFSRHFINSGIQFSCSLRCHFDMLYTEMYMCLIRNRLIRLVSVRKFFSWEEFSFIEIKFKEISIKLLFKNCSLEFTYKSRSLWWAAEVSFTYMCS